MHGLDFYEVCRVSRLWTKKIVLHFGSDLCIGCLIASFAAGFAYRAGPCISCACVRLYWYASTHQLLSGNDTVISYHIICVDFCGVAEVCAPASALQQVLLIIMPRTIYIVRIHIFCKLSWTGNQARMSRGFLNTAAFVLTISRTRYAQLNMMSL